MTAYEEAQRRRAEVDAREEALRLAREQAEARARAQQRAWDLTRGRSKS